LGNSGDASGCDFVYGEVLRKAGRAIEAVPYLQRAIDGFTNAEVLLGAAEAELELALTFRDLGNPEVEVHGNLARQVFREHQLPLRVQEVSELLSNS
jgi:hypothetical protein